MRPTTLTTTPSRHPLQHVGHSDVAAKVGAADGDGVVLLVGSSVANLALSQARFVYSPAYCNILGNNEIPQDVSHHLYDISIRTFPDPRPRP